MTRKPTIRDIAREAGVSDTAVSLAFQQSPRVSVATRTRILAIARRMSYFPNRSARNLRYGDSRTIGFVVIDITNPFYARMIRSAERIALELGYGVLFAESYWDPVREVRIVSNMIENRVAGMLMCFCEKTDETLGLLAQSRLPLIAVDTYPLHYRGAYVANALESAGRMAADHLAQAGCRAPVFFNASPAMSGFSSFQHLLKGFREGVHAAGLALPEGAVVHADWTIAGGVAGYEDLRGRGVPFDGIFCVNDLCALGVMEAAEKHGRGAGRDLAVVGIDNLEMAAVSRVSLTSIDQPYDRIIELAARSLIESIEKGEQPSIRKRLKPSLVVRGSSTLRARTAGT